MSTEAPVLVEWERTVGEILDRTARFPKVVRFTFSQRVDGLALDVLQGLVEARYARGRAKEEALVRVSQGFGSAARFASTQPPTTLSGPPGIRIIEPPARRHRSASRRLD